MILLIKVGASVQAVFMFSAQVKRFFVATIAILIIFVIITKKLIDNQHLSN